MTTTADVLAAIDAEGSSSWQIADAIATFDETDADGKPLTLKALAERIWEKRGVEWSPPELGRYRATALAFPIGARAPMHSFRAHMELRAHPDKLLNWKPTKPGDILTVERAKALRGRSSASHTKPDAWRDEMRRAFVTIGRLAENDPTFTIDMLEQTIAYVRRNHARQLKKAERGLQAV